MGRALRSFIAVSAGFAALILGSRRGGLALLLASVVVCCTTPATVAADSSGTILFSLQGADAASSPFPIDTTLSTVSGGGGVVAGLLSAHGDRFGFAAWRPDRGSIAFLRMVASQPPPPAAYTPAFSYQFVLSTISATGSNLRNLTPQQPWIALKDQLNLWSPPAWSPDGTRIAFGRGDQSDAQRPEVQIINSDGTNEHTLTKGIDPAWSPDGKEIAFFRLADSVPFQVSGLVRRNLATGVETVIPIALPIGQQFEGDTGLDWSPDGHHLAAVVKFPPTNGGGCFSYLATIEVDTGALSAPPSTCMPFGVNSPHWSPDGSEIAFCAYDGSIHALNVATGVVRTVIKFNAAPSGSSQKASWGLDWGGPSPNLQIEMAGFGVKALSGNSDPGQEHFVHPVIWDQRRPFDTAVDSTVPDTVGETLADYDASLVCPPGDGREWRSCDSTGKPTGSPIEAWPVVTGAKTRLVVSNVQVWVPLGTSVSNRTLHGDAGPLYGRLTARQPFSISATKPNRLVNVGGMDFADPAALTAKPDVVNLLIRWSLPSDSGKTLALGSTSLPVYVTPHSAFAQVTGGAVPKPYLTLVHQAVLYASGQSDDSAIFAQIFELFRTKAMHRAALNPKTGNVTSEHETLRYYHDGWSFKSIVTSQAYWDGRSARCHDDPAAGILYTGSGLCQEFASYLAEVAAVDGIRSRPFNLEAAARGHADMKNTAMLVGTWTFGITPCYNVYSIAGSTYVPLRQCATYHGAAGQGVTTSPGWFELGDHELVSFGGKVWDPSYGTGPFASVAAWAQHSIAGRAEEDLVAAKPTDYSVENPSRATCHAYCRWHFVIGPGNRFDNIATPPAD